jgi:hypothetical protein
VKSLLEGVNEPAPAWLKGKWTKRAGDRVANEVLENIGPRVSVIESSNGKKVILDANSVKIMTSTALRLLDINHSLLLKLY